MDNVVHLPTWRPPDDTAAYAVALSEQQQGQGEQDTSLYHLKALVECLNTAERVLDSAREHAKKIYEAADLEMPG